MLTRYYLFITKLRYDGKIIQETVRAAAIFGLIHATPVQALEEVQSSINVEQATDLCSRFDDKIYCRNFRIERMTPHASAVDVIPHVYNWRNIGQWRNAVLNGWNDGLDFIYQKGCNVQSIEKDYINARMSVILSDVSCLGY